MQKKHSASQPERDQAPTQMHSKKRSQTVVSRPSISARPVKRAKSAFAVTSTTKTNESINQHESTENESEDVHDELVDLEKTDSDAVDSASDSSKESDQDQVDSDSDNQDEIDSPHPKQPLSESKSLYRPPTNEEMRQLKETSELFKSSLFKLQIDELVAEVAVNFAKIKPLELALHRIKSILDNMDSVEPTPIAQAAANLRNNSGIVVPFGPAEPNKESKLLFAFDRPAKVAIVGSFLLRTMAKQPSGMNVDIAVQMPDSLFQEKDFTNHRYFQKRSCYLAMIAAEFQKQSKSEFVVDPSFEAHQNDLRHPILVLTSTKSAGDLNFTRVGFRVRIFTTIGSNVFPHARLAPGRNNVRQSPTILGKPDSTDVFEEDDAQNEHVPTPHYNNLILQDSSYIAHLNFMHKCVSDSSSFKEACILVRVWLCQRGLSESHRRGYGLNGFLVSMMMGWLLNASGPYANHRLGKALSSFQMLKATLDVLAHHDFTKRPFFLTPTGTEIDEPEFSSSAFMDAFDVAIVDPSGRVNLAAHLTRTAMDEIQLEAKLSSEMLRDESADHFDSLFLRQVDRPLLKYDNLVRIPRVKHVPVSYHRDHARLDTPDLSVYVIKFLPKLVKQALGDRLTLVTAYAPAYQRWSCTESWTSTNKPDAHEITLAMLLHPENSLRSVETGPSADQDDEVAAFRELWGDRAETRRFKDGSIVESVVFDTDGTFQQKSLIVMRMVAFLMARHARMVPEDGITLWAGIGGKFIRAPGIKTVADSFQAIVDAFQGLSRNLRSIKDLPLSITAVHPVSDALRYASVFVPQPKPTPSEFMDGYRPMTHVHDVVIEFESSSKWPDDLRAVQNMKRAFYIQLARLLMSQINKKKDDESGIVSARVSVGTNTNIEESGWLDVTYSPGYVFRLRIHHDRESNLLKKAVAAARRDGSPADVLGALSAQKTYLTDLVRRPWHASQMGNLCLRFPFLPITIRILKRWLSSHLLVSSSKSTGLSEEVLEILCARVYLSSAPYTVPSSGFVGFLRVVDLIVNWDWAEEPLIVELEKGSMNATLINSIKEKFKLSRSNLCETNSVADCLPAMFVATEADLDSSWWTSALPSRKLLERLIVIGRATLAHATEKFETSTDMDISQLFSSPLLGYSFLIHLDPKKVSRFHENLTFTSDNAPLVSDATKKKFKNIMTQADRESLLLTEFDPVEKYLVDLESAFSSVALFFHDKYGGDKIAGVWRPGAIKNGAWKVNLHFNAAPDASFLNATASKNKPSVHANVDAMLAEMQRLGSGLAIAIERR